VIPILGLIDGAFASVEPYVPTELARLGEICNENSARIFRVVGYPETDLARITDYGQEIASTAAISDLGEPQGLEGPGMR
jgi:hypothetical protein